MPEDFYRRKLPHFQPAESSFFITYRLAHSIPLAVLEKLKLKYKSPQDRKSYFIETEKILESGLNGPLWLNQEPIAKAVLDSLVFNDKKQYDLWCATLMGNHVHVVLTTLKNSLPLNTILQNHKKFSARLANKLLGRSGRFWAEESFDTLIRNERHFHNAVNYCLQNPVKARLVDNWKQWKYTYVSPALANGTPFRF